jgi:hypothetical protein
VEGGHTSLSGYSEELFGNSAQFALIGGVNVVGGWKVLRSPICGAEY